MHFSKTVAIVAALAPISSAHDGIELPRIVGLDAHDQRTENFIASLRNLGPMSQNTHSKPALEVRGSPRECGEGIGVCPADKCCSSVGYCGTSPQHCYSPNCDWKYGPACPDNQRPEGTNTSSIPRPKLGSIPYGTTISNCKVPGTVALTFDDGPLKGFTDHILDLLQSYNAKATFFITGNNINKGQIDKTEEHIKAIKRMEEEGHQIASHTWTHLNLDKISSADRKNQMWKLEMAINNIVGKIPTYMRPPYSSCDAGCLQDMKDLGYHLISFDVDTDDYQQSTPIQIQNSKDRFKTTITKNGATPKSNEWLAISHDILEQTANNLTEYMLSTLTQLGYKAVTVGECLDDPKENWYRQFGDSASRTGSFPSSENKTSSQASSTASTGTFSTESSSNLIQSSSSITGTGAPVQTTGAGTPVQTTNAAGRAPQGVGYLPHVITALLSIIFAVHTM